VFDPPEDIENTEILRYNLADLTSKESCGHYLTNSINIWKPFNFDRTIHHNLSHLINFLEELSQSGNDNTTPAQQFIPVIIF
jgi:hypothetical protein